MAAPRLCSIPDCGKSLVARGFCMGHYRRLMRYGDPLGGSTAKGELMRFVNEVALRHEGDECLIWPYAHNGKGYGQLSVCGESSTAHRYICQRAHGDPPTSEHEAAHSCGKGHLGCVTKGHLSWKTTRENSADRHLHGTIIRGEGSQQAKLTEAQAREILNLKGKMSQRKTAALFGVSAITVCHIRAGKRWAWLS